MFDMVEDKYIGLALAIVSTLAIGTSFVITKKGLNDAAEQHGFEGDGYAYLKTPLWWAGIASLVLGEVANFAAYAFAPAILVTPLGALSVLIGAVLGSYFLKEELGILGKLGCAMCLLGSVIIVLHSPPDEEIETVDQILSYAMRPGKAREKFVVPVAVANSHLNRIHHLLPGRHHLLDCHDLQGGPHLREEKPVDLHLHLFDGGVGVGHVGQGVWDRVEVDVCGQQSIHPCLDICVYGGDGGVHLDSDELFQQGVEPVLDVDCQPVVLCHVYDGDAVRVVYPLLGIQHDGRGQHDFAAVRLPGDLCRSISAQPVAGRPGRAPVAEWQNRRRRHPHRSAGDVFDAAEHASAQKYRPASTQQQFDV